MSSRIWLALVLLALTLPLSAGASASFHPAVGEYKGALHVQGTKTEVEFVLGEDPLHVARFDTIHAHHRTHYFAHVQVHNHEFSWTSHEHPNLHIHGKWTGSRTVSGTIRNREGVVHHWSAEKSGINGFARRLASAAFVPKGGGYKADIGGRHLTFDYIHHPPKTVHVFFIGNLHYSGTAYVFDTKFNFHGHSHISNEDLHVVGDWKSAEVVEGTYELGHADAKHFRAHYVPPASGGGPLRPGHGAQSVSPALGMYRGLLHGTGFEVTVHYWDSPHPRMANFETRLGHEYKRYFSDVRVHDGAFTWTSPEHSNLHIAGHFTGTRTIAGTLRNKDGVVHHWEVTHARFVR